MKKTSTLLSIYTCTYNRGYTLPRLYKSLISSTVYPAQWIIIDDGSTDNTIQLVTEWKKESLFPIAYHKQINKGKQKAADWAHQLISTELHTCIDSDDSITPKMIEEVEVVWRKEKTDNLYGLIGLDVYEDFTLVGNDFTNKPKTSKFSNLLKHGIFGDKKFVLRTDLVQEQGDYPSFEGEKFPAPGYLYRLLDQKHELLLVNSPWCVVEYLEDGISKNKFKQFLNNPNSTYFYRSELFRLSSSTRDRIRQVVHGSAMLWLGARMKNSSSFIFALFTFSVLPAGALLALYIRRNHDKGVIQ